VTEEVPRSHAESERNQCFEFGLFSRGHWHQDLLLGYEIKTKKLSHNLLINLSFGAISSVQSKFHSRSLNLHNTPIISDTTQLKR